MKKTFKKIAFFLFCTASLAFFSGFTIYLFFPHIVADYFTNKTFREIGLEVKTLDADGLVFEYVEGGSGETVVFFHGFQGDKTSWNGYLKRLISQYHVIAVDLPGHGGTNHLEGQKYDIHSQATTMDQFIQHMNLDSFHLVGISMGGGIGAVYARLFPEKLISLSLLNPYGLVTAPKSELHLKMEKGVNVMFPHTLAELDEFGRYIMGHPFELPRVFKKYLLGKLVEKRAFYRKVFTDLVMGSPLEPVLAKIKTPTFVLIGGDDRVIHPSSLQVFLQKLPNRTFKLVQHGAHVFIGPHFEEAISSLHEFLNSSRSSFKAR